MYEIIAACLLSMSPGTSTFYFEDSEWRELQSALWTTAINWEILDSRETSYMFSQRGSFENDLKVMQQRYVDLKGYPLMKDITWRFPDRKTCQERLTFNRAFRIKVDGLLALETDRRDFNSLVLAETDFCWKVWDNIGDSTIDSFYVTSRRFAIKRLILQIGAENFYNGNIPPFVPTWRFREQD